MNQRSRSLGAVKGLVMDSSDDWIVLSAADGTLYRIERTRIGRYLTLRSGQEWRCSRRARAAYNPENVLIADWDGRYYLVPRGEIGLPPKTPRSRSNRTKPATE